MDFSRSSMRFRSGRSTVDMVFTTRQLLETFVEPQLDLYEIPIDLSEGFDTMNTGALWKSLMKLRHSLDSAF